MRVPVAMIGNGGAAAEAVLALRAEGYRGDIHLFADNRHPPYNPMLGPHLVGGRIPLEQAFPFGDERAFYEANRVTAHLGEPVVRLDAEARELAAGSGGTYTYERCLVATGARPAVPPIAGLREALLSPNAAPASGRRVFTLQTLEDALALKQAAHEILGADAGRAPGGERAQGASPPRAAVVGASFAGVKIAEVLHDLGFRVTLIEREASILPLAAHPEAARIMEGHLLKEGYELRLGAALASVELLAAEGGGSSAAGSGSAETGAVTQPSQPAIRLDFGALPGAADPGGAGGTACEDGAPQEDVDLLVVCTGNRPALNFLTAGQVDIGTGILVDEHMRSNIPGLYAAGDVAQGKNLMSGRREIIALWSNARYQGRAAGRSLAGAAPGYAGGVPHNITHVGRMLFASVGCVDDYEKVTISQNEDSWQIRLWRDGRLVGVNLLNCCLSAGVVRQALMRAATGATADTEATWTSFSA